MTETLIERWAKRVPHYRCPECGKISFNAHDIHERYCGRCHMFEAERRPTNRVTYDDVVRHRRREEEEEERRRRSSDDTPTLNPFASPSTWEPPASTYEAPPTAPPDPPAFDPGGGSSGGGGASGDW